LRAIVDGLYAEALVLSVPGQGSQRYHDHNTMGMNVGMGMNGVIGKPHPLVVTALEVLKGILGPDDDGGGGHGGSADDGPGASGGGAGSGSAGNAGNVEMEEKEKGTGGLDPWQPMALHLFIHLTEGRPLTTTVVKTATETAAVEVNGTGDGKKGRKERGKEEEEEEEEEGGQEEDQQDDGEDGGGESEWLGPSNAVVVAERLTMVGVGVGHLVHMPSHIFARVGRYEDSVNHKGTPYDSTCVVHTLVSHLYMIVHSSSCSMVD
jgi:hypothetical protein